MFLPAVSDSVVTGAAALLGAIIGGAITAAVQLSVERGRATRELAAETRQAERDGDREQIALRAAARLMSEDFVRFVQRLPMIQTGAWWPSELALAPSVGPEDRKLVAGHLSREDWDVVAVADARVAYWEAVRAAATGPPLPNMVDAFTDADTSVRRGIDALVRVQEARKDGIGFSRP